MDLGPRSASARDGGVAAGEAEVGRCERPAVARPREHRGLAKHQRSLFDPSAAGQPDSIRRYVGKRRKGESRATPSGKGRAHLAHAVHQLGIGDQPRERDPAGIDAAGIDHAVDGRPLVGEDDRAVDAPAADREGPGEVHVVGDQVRVDALRLPSRRKIERAAKSAVCEHQLACEAAGVRAQIAARMRPAGIERGDGDYRAAVRRQQDSAAAGERAELRPARRAIVEARRGRSQQQAHRADAERVVGSVEEQVEPRTLDPAVERHP